MATMNPFDLLGDDDNDDPSHLIAVHQQKIAAKKPSAAAAAPVKAPAKLPVKPLPPTQAVREARSATAPFRGGGGGRGRGGGGRGRGHAPNRDFGNGNVEGFGGSYGGGGGKQDGEGGKGSNTRGERGSYGAPYQSYGGGGYRQHKDGENAADERPNRRQFERKSGTGRGNEFKREGSGRGNWGTATDDVIAEDVVEVVNIENKVPIPEKQLDKEVTPGSEANKEASAKEVEEKEEEKEMTLEEYEKVREEKRKALLSMKTEERKVVLDKELKSMKQLSIKKGNDDIFIKLDSDKDLKKQRAERDEKAKKSVSINEFLKPAEGEKYYNPASRGGRGRGRGSFRGGRGGDSGLNNIRTEAIIKIEDPGQFPTLGGK